jgi:hypothetical protein
VTHKRKRVPLAVAFCQHCGATVPRCEAPRLKKRFLASMVALLEDNEPICDSCCGTVLRRMEQAIAETPGRWG